VDAGAGNRDYGSSGRSRWRDSLRKATAAGRGQIVVRQGRKPLAPSPHRRDGRHARVVRVVRRHNRDGRQG